MFGQNQISISKDKPGIKKVGLKNVGSKKFDPKNVGSKKIVDQNEMCCEKIMAT